MSGGHLSAEYLTAEDEAHGVRVRLRALRQGADWLVSVSGGDAEHIGAVALAHPRPSLSGAGTSATASVLTLTGHKEDLLARETALFLAARLNAAVCVACGVHVDRATLEQIRAVEELVPRLAAGLAPRMAEAVLKDPAASGH